ncbi:MAG: M17 family peptidase N-terminal domain-containing protein, partial [Caldimonas sp.]
MDFRHQITPPGTLAALRLDALVLVVTGEAVDPALDPALAALLADAVELGDLKLKAGKSLYLHRPAGVAAARVVFAVAEGNTPKAVKAAATHAFAQVKGSGARHIGIGLAGAGVLGQAHAEA